MNQKTLIGSKALATHIPLKRPPKDEDYFSLDPIPQADCFWHPNLSLWDFKDVASLNELYTIKVSHSFWDLHGTWEKHMFDILEMKKCGATLIPSLYGILYPIWEEIHGPKAVNLESSPEDFFNSNVHRVYEHDSIHDSVAYYDRPPFLSILRDGHQVAVSRQKFEALSPQDKDRLVFEEIYATALERFIIPSDYTYSSLRAYSWALKKLITSFSKGWFALYVVDNFDRFTRPDVDYVARHKANAHKLKLTPAPQAV